jgi:DNA-binding transcriptional ArsR family regulator
MTAQPPPLHDLRGRPRRLPVVVHDSPAFDLLLALWSAFGGDDKSSSHTLGRRWFDRFRMSLPDETRKAVAALGEGAGTVFLALFGLFESAPVDHDLDVLADWLEQVDGAELRRRVLREKCWEADSSDVEAAAAGDTAAADRLIENLDPAKRDVVKDFLAYPVESVAMDLAQVLRDARKTAFLPFESQWAPALAAQASETRALAESIASPSELIERITNGIDYEIPFGIARLVLIPSVTIRPWTIVSDHDNTLLVAYPVSDQHLSSDPEAPPSGLINTYRALGDEKRMRILRRLHQSPAGLAELTEFLGLAKSTVFHHIGVLRAAGLIRVQLGKDQSPAYSLRSEAIPDARNLFDLYLGA